MERVLGGVMVKEERERDIKSKGLLKNHLEACYSRSILIYLLGI